MNENLDLVKILKDCPKGTKLYTTMYGDVTFDGIVGGNYWPIHAYGGENISTIFFCANGHYSEPDKGECVLFPSKDNRDWSTFKVPKKHKVFKPYDRVIIRYAENKEHEPWKPSFYACYLEDNDRHCMIGGEYAEDANILPYEGNEDKVGKITD